MSKERTEMESTLVFNTASFFIMIGENLYNTEWILEYKLWFFLNGKKLDIEEVL